jgi:hypothetical protein
MRPKWVITVKEDVEMNKRFVCMNCKKVNSISNTSCWYCKRPATEEEKNSYWSQSQVRSQSFNTSCLVVCILILFLSASIYTYVKDHPSKATLERRQRAEQTKKEIDAKIAHQDSLFFTSSYGKRVRTLMDKKGWSRETSQNIIDRKIWIGMPIEGVYYQRGKPNDINISNYGKGIQRQYVWYNWNPSCFYDENSDGLVDAYN